MTDTLEQNNIQSPMYIPDSHNHNSNFDPLYHKAPKFDIYGNLVIF
jgi:hypothetical protein